MTTPDSRSVALITGGTTGIGLATARAFHALSLPKLLHKARVSHLSPR